MSKVWSCVWGKKHSCHHQAYRNEDYNPAAPPVLLFLCRVGLFTCYSAQIKLMNVYYKM